MKPQFEGIQLYGGHCRFIVTNPEGDQYTYRVKAWESRKTNKMWYFVTTIDRTDTSFRLGTLEDTGEFTHGEYRADVSSEDLSVGVFIWAVRQILNQNDMAEGYSITLAGTCAVCGRPLGVEESILRGIGPVCYKKAVKNSKRVRILAEAQLQAFEEVGG